MLTFLYTMTVIGAVAGITLAAWSINDTHKKYRDGRKK